MDFSNVAVVALLLIAFNGVCLAVVYDVGGAAGWTKNGAVDYNAWAASKKFFVGDTIVFKYKNGEKLLRVNHADFKKCDTRFPVTTYTSGDDSFLMKRATHLYYISAVYGDCMAGQKVDIKVLSSAHSAPTLSPSPSPAVPESPWPAPASTPNASPSPAVPDSPSVAPALTPEATPSPAVPDSPSVSPALTPEATPSPAIPDSPPSAPVPSPNASPSPASASGLLSFSSLPTFLSMFLAARLITG